MKLKEYLQYLKESMQTYKRKHTVIKRNIVSYFFSFAKQLKTFFFKLFSFLRNSQNWANSDLFRKTKLKYQTVKIMSNTHNIE